MANYQEFVMHTIAQSRQWISIIGKNDLHETINLINRVNDWREHIGRTGNEIALIASFIPSS